MITTNNILTSPSIDNVSELLKQYNKSIKKQMTKEEFYYFLTSSSVEREELLLNIKSSPIIDNNVIINKYEFEN